MLIIVRHGRTAANAAGLLLGRDDPPLDEVGVVQADAIGRALGPVDRIVSSPLGRCRTTAERLECDDVEIDDRWIELDYGEFEGRPFGEVPAGTWERWRSDVTFTPPGGESLAAVGQRVRAALDDLATQAATDSVVVVTHVSPIKAALAWALGVGDEVAWRTHVLPASITRIRVGDAGPLLAGFNDVAHLDG